MAAGCKAAARLNRLSSNYQVTIIEKGSFISFSSCGLPLYAAGEINDLSDLNKTPYGILRDENFFRDIKDVRVLSNTEVIAIDAERNKIQCKSIDKEEVFELSYDYLVLATGSETIEPNFPCPSSSSISSFHSPEDVKYFRQAAQKGEVNKAVIIGGGFIGCQMVEALTSLWGINTVLVEKEKSILPKYLDPEISYYLENCINDKKIQLIFSAYVNKVEIDEKGKPVVFINDDQKINSDYLFFCLGIKPNTKLALKSNIKTGNYGGILVDEKNENKYW